MTTFDMYPICNILVSYKYIFQYACNRFKCHNFLRKDDLNIVYKFFVHLSRKRLMDNKNDVYRNCNRTSPEEKSFILSFV